MDVNKTYVSIKQMRASVKMGIIAIVEKSG